MVSRNLGAVLDFYGGGTLTLEFSIAELKDRGNNLDFVFNCLGLWV